MTYNPHIHHRRSVRLQKYDYSRNGAYFVTVCTQGKRCLFGEIVSGKMELNDAGRMVKKVWTELAHRFDHIQLDTYVIMPNHIHGIVSIVGAPLVGAQNRAGTRPAPTSSSSLGNIVGAFKSIATNEYIKGVKQCGWLPFSGKLWQRNYYERIIRDDNELNGLRQYIIDNPLKWDLDRENPGRVTAPPVPLLLKT